MSEPSIAELLRFEGAHRRHTSLKEEQIRAELHVTPARFYQLLRRAIRTEEALRQNPILTHRLLDQAERARASEEVSVPLHVSFEAGSDF